MNGKKLKRISLEPYELMEARRCVSMEDRPLGERGMVTATNDPMISPARGGIYASDLLNHIDYIQARLTRCEEALEAFPKPSVAKAMGKVYERWDWMAQKLHDWYHGHLLVVLPEGVKMRKSKGRGAPAAG